MRDDCTNMEIEEIIRASVKIVDAPAPDCENDLSHMPCHFGICP